MRPFTPILVSSFLLLVAAPAEGATLKVPAQFATIQAALDAAGNGDTVLVAAGTYTGAGNRDLDPLGKAITVTGEGGAAATILDVQGTSGAPHRGFVLTAGGSFLVIDGFTIRNGHHANGGGILVQGLVTAKLKNLVVEQCVADGVGGGMHLLGGAGPTIDQCIFRFNQATQGAGVRIDKDCFVAMTGTEISDNGASAEGGGLSVSGFFANPGTTFVTLTDCDIDRNTAPNFGAGVVLFSDVDATFTGCRIRDNVADGGSPEWGGGLLVEFRSKATLTGCELSGNGAGAGGGLFLQQDGVAHLIDCQIQSNHAKHSGGGIHMNGQGTPLATTLEMDGCLVDGNTADEFGAGLNVSLPVVANVRTTTFRGNVVGPLFPSWGGAVMTGFACEVSLEDCLIEQNQADAGAGLFVQQDAQVEVNRCTLRGNLASKEGGGVHMNGQGTPFVTDLEIVDTLIEGNVAENTGGGFSAFGEVTARFERTCFVGNKTGNGSPQFGGGFYTNLAPDLTLVDCVVRENIASSGGGAYFNWATTVEVTGASFVGNTAFSEGGGLVAGGGAIVDLDRATVTSNLAGSAGGGLLAEGAATLLSVKNSLVADNNGPIGGGVRIKNSAATTLVNTTVAGNTGTFAGGISEAGGTATITGSVVHGNSPATLQQTGGVSATYSDLESGLAGTGNLNVAPGYVDAAGGDYRLSLGSACIDAADNGANPGALDVEGAPRFFDDLGVADTGVGPAPIADMGAHERYPSGPFHPYGDGCPGSGVVAPRLTVGGDPVPNGTITLRVDKARGGASAFLLLGLGTGQAPIGAGCDLYLSPVLPNAIGPLPLSGTGDAGFGTFALPVVLPSTATQVSITLQALVGDPGSPLGFNASNGFLLGLL